MAIYLDANVFWSWRTFAEPARLALSIVAAQLGQEILVPWVAAEEGAARHRRLLQDSVAKLEAAEAALRQAFGSNFAVDVEPVPDVDSDVERWRAALAEFASVLPLEDGAARQALEREIYGVAPARRTDKTAVGSRDAAIWLTIAADHGKRGEEGHFVSANSKDFAHDGQLRPELAGEIPDDCRPLRLHLGANAFLDLLGTPVEHTALTLDALARWAEPALIRGLENSDAIVRAVVERREPGLWYGAGVVSAMPTEITRVGRYERDGEAVTIVDARWRVTAQLRYYPIALDNPNEWWLIDDVPLEGSAQVYLPEKDGEERDAALISAQLRSDMIVDAHEDGTAESWTISSGSPVGRLVPPLPSTSLKS